ncbi:hypothetical protein BDP27DRAFT_264244 [Rhodocollybia butyracea]|uniref:Uncharacterized protein n=1 Tax=Rhodocollybia butyracea TaxID=206335 RepID=A0A9P5UC51_9AGAR|nr:hypothetical protein BDP27DRAFT_264244 [Rhodocollybia butyracea]
MRESDNYKFFIVPFGRSGKMINQVRDIQWLRRIQGSRVRRKRYPLFLKAVDLWIANPRHYEQTRDIGQSLARSQNDLYQEKESGSYETPDEDSSGSFIQNDAEDEETESADGIVHDTNEAESEDYGESEQSTSLELESVNKDDDEIKPSVESQILSISFYGKDRDIPPPPYYSI